MKKSSSFLQAKVCKHWTNSCRSLVSFPCTLETLKSFSSTCISNWATKHSQNPIDVIEQRGNLLQCSLSSLIALHNVYNPLIHAQVLKVRNRSLGAGLTNRRKQWWWLRTCERFHGISLWRKRLWKFDIIENALKCWNSATNWKVCLSFD